MSTLSLAPETRLDPDEERLLFIPEFELPPLEESLDEQAELERERYDEQILAALVSP